MVSINVTPLTYSFDVFVSPSVPDGTSHLAASYVVTPLHSTVTFGGPGNTVVAGTFYTAASAANGPLVVSAGDRVGIRVRTNQPSDPSAADVTQLSFNASFQYIPN